MPQNNRINELVEKGQEKLVSILVLEMLYKVLEDTQGTRAIMEGKLGPISFDALPTTNVENDKTNVYWPSYFHEIRGIVSDIEDNLTSMQNLLNRTPF